MELNVIFLILSGLVSLFVFINYVYSIFYRGTEPHMYTWLIWFITQATAVAGMWYGGGGLGALAITFSTLSVFLIFLLSIKYGTKNITRSDTYILILALFAIVIWWVLGDPLISIIMVIAIDMFGYIPSWRKSAQEPWSETLISWSISPFGHIFAIAALSSYNFYTVAYPLSIILANYILVVICLYFRRKVTKPNGV